MSDLETGKHLCECNVCRGKMDPHRCPPPNSHEGNIDCMSKTSERIGHLALEMCLSLQHYGDLLPSISRGTFLVLVDEVQDSKYTMKGNVPFRKGVGIRNGDSTCPLSLLRLLLPLLACACRSAWCTVASDRSRALLLLPAPPSPLEQALRREAAREAAELRRSSSCSCKSSSIAAKGKCADVFGDVGTC